MLRANNTRLYPEWHRYAQRLYGARGVARSFPLDLNELSWFYWFAPLRLQSRSRCRTLAPKIGTALPHRPGACAELATIVTGAAV